ncbi:DoxX family membrane protein [Cellulomonas gilvus]|uniref:DoxX family protein n=1 Tax=Cellulomonas gilvus (strain ATCC 13127 / NRRL B-14078) TaxID=593907 RepID=F8A1G1_CELGA|nr:DoxX family membrane protein [Cellulomonas gilvus]AEI12845.1 DoxX family protein [Cellulomonas gilvus ATCC 13127]
MLLRRLARPLFATWFVTEGIDALRRPVPHVADARAVLARVERARPDARVDVTDAQLTGIVRAHGAAVVTAGAMLALGKAPRTAALALAALTAPLVLATLPERGAKRLDPVAAQARQDRLVRTLAFAAGAVLVAADREGRPGVAWRLQDARARRAAAAAEHDD